MTTELLPDVETIEALDFAPPCDLKRCDHEAEWCIKCRHCRVPQLLCDEHLREFVAFLTEKPAHKITCLNCDNTSKTFDAAIEVIQL